MHGHVRRQLLDRIVRVADVAFDVFHDPVDQLAVERRNGNLGGRDVGLGGETPDPPPPLLDEIADPRQQHLHVEGLAQIGVGTRFVPFAAHVVLGASREQDDRDVRGLDVVLQPLAELESVHAGHHHIADDDVRMALVGFTKPFLAVFGLPHVELPRKFLRHIGPEIGIVLDDQQAAMGRCHPGSLRRFGAFGFRFSGIRGTERHGNLDPEGAATPQFRVNTDLPTVHFCILFDQTQSDTGALRRRVAGTLIETLEDMFPIRFGDPHAGVGNLQTHPFRIGLRQPHDNAPALGRKLHGIRQQVVHDLVHLRRIKSHVGAGHAVVEGQVQLLLAGHVPERIDQPLDKLHDVALREVEPFAVHFKFAEIQQVIHQRQKLRSMAVDGQQLRPERGRIVRTANDAFERQENQRQRGPQFVGDVREEAEFHLVHLLALPHLLFKPVAFGPQPQPAEDVENAQYDHQQCGQRIKHERRRALPERRMDRKGDRSLGFAPIRIVVGSRNAEHIIAGFKQRIGRRTCSPGMDLRPLAVEIFESIAVDRMAGIGIVEVREFEREERLIVLQIDMLHLPQFAGQDAAAVEFLADLHRTIEDPQPGDDDRRTVVTRLVKRRRIDETEPVSPAGIKAAVTPDHQRVLKKSSGLHAVRRTV